MIVYRKYLKPELEYIKICKNYIWVKIKNLNSFNTLTGNANHLYLCACYIPPITSPYFNEELFHDLNEDINNFSNSQSPLLLCGDLNSRTGNIPDFTCNTKDGNLLTDQITTQIDTYRGNFDSEVNSNGQNLSELCKGNNLRIINGRCFEDSFGKYTFFSSDNKKSMVDYSIVSDYFFKKQFFSCQTTFIFK